MGNNNGQLKTFDEAKPAARQHTSPCSDCPWARKAVKGWLGNMTVEGWLNAVHGEALVDCHTVSNQQCAGSAIYRANVCKSPRRNDVLRLKADRIKVFASRDEFRAHHDIGLSEPEDGDDPYDYGTYYDNFEDS